MIDFASISISDLLPHKSPMVLIDEVVDFTQDSIKARLTITNKSLFFDKGVVPSYVGLEYMAQTVAAWNGLIARQKQLQPRIGFLLAARKLKLEVTSFKEGDVLNISGHCAYTDGEMASFNCSIYINEIEVALASLTVVQPKLVEMSK